MTFDKLSEAFEPLREGLVADGADLHLIAVDGSEAMAELVVSDKTCLECILPKGQLEQTLLVIGKEAWPDLTRVVLRDPREGAEAL